MVDGGSEASGRGQRERLTFWIIVAVVTSVAFVLRLRVVLRGGGLEGLGSYDDGVYFSASDALVHGRLPYHSYLFLQPPGITVLLTPFTVLAALTTDAFGFAVGRVAFMLLGSASAALVAMILRRYGLRAAAIGGIFYATSFPAIYSERSTLLEPPCSFAVLATLWILSDDRRRSHPVWTLVAGAALGMTLTVKIWYLVPFLIIVAFNRAQWRRLVLGAAVVVGVVYLPFVLASPRALIREVVVDQLGRARTGGDFLTRVRVVLGGVHDRSHAWWWPGLSDAHLTLVLIVVVIPMVVVAARNARTRLAVALFVADVVVLLASPSFYLHYAVLPAGPLAIIVGYSLAQLTNVPRRRVARTALGLTAVAGLVAYSWSPDLVKLGRPVPTHRLQTAGQAVHGCIQADDPTILILMNVLSRDLSHGCSFDADPTGITYDRDDIKVEGQELPRNENVRWQRYLLHYLHSGSAEILVRNPVLATGLSPATIRVLRRDRILFRDGRYVLRSTEPTH